MGHRQEAWYRAPGPSDRKRVKILFLDIDGVLNRVGQSYPADDAPSQHYEPYCVLQLNRILLETRARVVLSSHWRGGRLGRDVERYLRQWGVVAGADGRIVYDVTPEGPLELSGAEGRAAEIHIWLADHAAEVTRHLAVDDLDLRAWVRAHLVNPQRGLTADDARRIVARLNR